MCRHFMEKQTLSQQPQENRQPLHLTTHKELTKHYGCTEDKIQTDYKHHGRQDRSKNKFLYLSHTQLYRV